MSAMLFGTALLVRESYRATLHLRALQERGRAVPALDHELDLPGTLPLRRVVSLGDSAAAGHGLADADLAIARLVGRRLAAFDGRATAVRSAAVDGADLRHVLDHQLEAARDAEVVLLGVGVNDAIRCHGPRRVARETTELIDRVREIAAPTASVVLVSCPDLSVAPALPAIVRWPLRLWCAVTARTQANVAAGRDVLVQPLPREHLGPDVFGDDGFHPGPIGHERLAAAVLRHLTDRGEGQ